MAYILNRENAKRPPQMGVGKHKVVVKSVKGQLKDGTESALITFINEAHEAHSEVFNNKRNQDWKIDALANATPDFTMVDGTVIDFDQSDTFVPFLEQFVGLTLGIDIGTRTYQQSQADGTKVDKTVTQIKRYIQPNEV